MRQWNDAELLSAYANRQSEEAFGVLVERYVALVYSAALRQVQNPHVAEDVTQAAFILLAQKARRLKDRTVLSGWLCHTAHFVARNALKAERRRQSREQEAHMQSLINEPEAEVWQQFAPLLDEAVAKLNETDRDAVVLRFYEQKPLNEVGDILGIDPDAAQKRVSRALGKLRKFFVRRGVTLPAAVIAGAVSANSVHAAPVALAKTVTAAAVAKGAAAPISTLTLIKGALKIMAWTKAKTAMIVGVAALLTATTATVVVKKVVYPNAWADDHKYWQIDSRVLNKLPAGVFIFQPTRFPKSGGGVWAGDRMLVENYSVPDLVDDAYGFSHARTVFPTGMPREHFDVMSTVRGGAVQPLKNELQKRFHLTAHPETRETKVLLLEVQNPAPPDLKLHAGNNGNSSWIGGNGKITIRDQTLHGFFSDIESRVGLPVLDETGLRGRYDLQLQWHARPGETDKDAYVRALRDQLGLELVPSRKPIKMLVVIKAT